MQVTLKGDSFGRVAGTIEHNGASATVTAAELDSAITDLRSAVESALSGEPGECFWLEATGQYRWLFRREGNTMRVVVLWSIGTLTGWEHRFWAECDVQDFQNTMCSALEACGAFAG